MVVSHKWDLSPYSSAAAGQAVYKLTAVISHFGSMGGSHYTAQCRSTANGGWFTCNDSNAVQARTVDGPSRAAYLLLYKWQDC